MVGGGSRTYAGGVSRCKSLVSLVERPSQPNQVRLRNISLSRIMLTAGSRWFRIHRSRGTVPTRWDEFRYLGPMDARFDHHVDSDDGEPFTQERGIIYAAADFPTCVAEVFQQSRVVDPKHARPILVSFKLTRSVNLLDLTDTFPLRVGASQKVIQGPREHSRIWSRAFYDGYPELEGVYYLSALTNRPAIALYERTLVDSPLPPTPEFHRTLDDPLMLDPLHEACVDIGYSLLV